MTGSCPRRILRFYLDGFRSMTVGRILWMIIFFKLFILFFILRLFFFPDYLNSRFETDVQRADYVLDMITRPAAEHNR